MTQESKKVKVNVLELLETSFWMVVTGAFIIQLACGLFIILGKGKDMEILKWWYAGSLIVFSLFGILAVTLTYKIRKVNVKTRRQMFNARMALFFSWIFFLVSPGFYGLAPLNQVLLGRSDAFSLVLSPPIVFAVSIVFPVILWRETRPVKSVWE